MTPAVTPVLEYIFAAVYNDVVLLSESSRLGLKGNLSTVNLADVFQVLTRGNSTGLLRIQAPEGPRFVEIQNGAISIAGRSGGRILLGDLLLSRGLIDEARLEEALNSQRESGKLLGQILIDQNFVELPQLEQALKFQIEEEVCELFTLGKGDFDFLAGAALDAKIAPGGGLVRLKIDPNSLLLEAARRADEWKGIEQKIPSQNMVFRLTPQGGALVKSGEGLSPEGMVLLKLVQDTRSIESMVQKACMGRLSTNQMLSELWDAGLIEPLPLESYLQASQSHLKLNRVDEAQRLAEFAQANGGADEKTKAQAAFAEIEKAKKAAISGTMAATTDPKVRSEVIRRNNPNLFKKDRPLVPIIIGAVVLLLAGGGAGAYFMLYSSKAADPKFRKLYEEQLTKADEAITAQDYAKGLELLRTFRSADPEIQKLAQQHFEDRRKDVEVQLEKAITNFKTAYTKGPPEALRTAADELDRFNTVVSLSEAAQKDFAGTRTMLEQYKNRERLEISRTRLREVELNSKNKTYDALRQDYEKLLGLAPPEEIAADIRDKLDRLIHLRGDAENRLRLAGQEKLAGETESARILLDMVKRDGPGSDYTGKAVAALEVLEKDIADVQKALDHVDVLQTQKQLDDARAELKKVLESHPPDRLFVSALDTYQALNTEPETALEKEFEQAMQLKDGNPAECRKRVLALLEKAPLSKTASKISLAVVVTTEPPGADVFFNGRAVSKTPATLTVPAMGLAHVTIKKQGFQPEDVVESNMRRETIALTLNKVAAAYRRLPAPASGGMAGSADNLVAACGPEAVFCANADLRITARVKFVGPTDDPKPLPSVQNGKALTLTSDGVFVTLAEKGFARAKPQENEFLRMGALTGSSAPLKFTSKEAPGKRLYALATQRGVEIVSDDGSPFKNMELNADVAQPWGLGVDGEMLLLPRAGSVFGLLGGTGIKQWETPVEGQLFDGLAVIPTPKANTFAVVSSTGQLIGFASDTGVKKFQRDLGGPPAVALIAIGAGFVTALADGKLELSSPDKGQALWSVTLGAAVLSPVAVRSTEKEPEKALAVCFQQKETFYVGVLSAGAGALLWRAELPAKPVSMASFGERVYVGTADGEVYGFDVN